MNDIIKLFCYLYKYRVDVVIELKYFFTSRTQWYAQISGASLLVVLVSIVNTQRTAVIEDLV